MNGKVSTTKLYIMQTNVGLVKIGVSKVVESRLETLQMVSPFQVECAAVVYVLGSSRGVYNIEKSLHHKFKDYNKVFPERFDGSTEYFTVSVSDVLEALKEFSEVAYADRRERIVYHEDFKGVSHTTGLSTSHNNTNYTESVILSTPVITVRDCASRLSITLKEAGKLLRENGYIKTDKPLGTKTMKEHRNIYTKLSPKETAEYLKADPLWKKQVRSFISGVEHFTWNSLMTYLKDNDIIGVEDKDLSLYLKSDLGYTKSQMTLNKVRATYWYPINTLQ